MSHFAPHFRILAEQVEFFLQNGYVVIKQAFTREKAAEWMKSMWIRLGVDPNDKATWTEERVHMPVQSRQAVSTFAPKVNHQYDIGRSLKLTVYGYKAWEAIKELLGGEERIDEQASTWGDSFIVNFGTPECEGAPSPDPKDLTNWHVDGDFFVHFLDSPEQALLVIPLYTDIKPRGGGTYLCPEGIEWTAKYLASHPEGVRPVKCAFVSSTSSAADPKEDPSYFSHCEQVQNATHFVETTGEIGDVVLMHPLMYHSASMNYLREARVITNPPVALREPFKFARDDPEEYSLVELKTLKALGVDRFECKPTTERRLIVPERVLIQQKMLEEERKRLEAMKENGNSAIAQSPAPIAVA